MAPSLTGRGWGWVVFLAAEAVSQFPGPPLEDPPTSPPHKLTGAPWGEHGGTTGARAAPSPRSAQRCGRCASSPGAAVAAQPTERSRAVAALRPTCHQGSRRRATGAAVEPLRASVCVPAFSGPAAGMAGDRGGDLAGAAPSGAQRSDLQASQFAKRASLKRSVRESGPAIPGHGNGPLLSSPPATPACRSPAAHCVHQRGECQRACVRDGSPTGARRWAFDSGSTRSATARPRTAGTRPGPQRPGISSSTPFTPRVAPIQRQPGSPFCQLRQHRVALLDSCQCRTPAKTPSP